MYKYLLVALFIFQCIACDKEENDDRIPHWLDEMIQERQDTDLWEPASVIRYVWNEEYIYEFNNPLLSCAFCEIYFEDGEKVNWEVYDITDYLLRRTNYLVIYDFPENER